jgi:hypothetical protein
LTERAIYVVALFFAAALSFAIEPMAAKALLPALGGSSAVWTTCLLFFQLALLAGYAAQFALARIRAPSARLLAHATILLGPLALARFDLVERAALSARSSSPVLAALAFLAVTVGAPFAALSTVAPALQRYFTLSNRESPYRLYAASNLGSMAGLFGYPLLIEPTLSLPTQSTVARLAYAAVVFVVLALGARATRRSHGHHAESAEQASEASSDRGDAPSWALLAAIPSALLATTSALIASDLPGVPLLWVLPLATYLATFVAAFRRAKPAPRWMSRALVLLALILVPLTARRMTSPFALLLALYLGFLAIASFTAHARVASLAPSARRLERFYLAIAVGGALGTLAFGVLPPMILSDLWEMPLAVALACASNIEHDPREASRPRARWLWAALPALWVLAVSLWVRSRAIDVSAAWVGAAYVPAILLAGRNSTHARSFVATLAAFALAASTFEASASHTLARARGFFGTARVQSSQRGAFTVLVHGTTIHGVEKRSLRGQCVPRAYYFREGPLGRAFAARRQSDRVESVLAVGIGAGSIVCFARPGERWTFVEIDPAVAELALDRRFFTFLSDNPLGHAPEIKIADGRLALRDEPPASRSLVIIDAFSSDSVPLHLLTRESLRLSLRALDRDGWLLMHVSNHALDLPRVLSALVREEGVAARTNADAVDFTHRGNTPTWVVIARDPRSLEPLGSQWIALPDPRGLRAFTDNHASIVPVIRW